jgi:hypothetical protein
MATRSDERAFVARDADVPSPFGAGGSCWDERTTAVLAYPPKGPHGTVPAGSGPHRIPGGGPTPCHRRRQSSVADISLPPCVQCSILPLRTSDFGSIPVSLSVWPPAKIRPPRRSTAWSSVWRRVPRQWDEEQEFAAGTLATSDTCVIGMLTPGGPIAFGLTIAVPVRQQPALDRLLAGLREAARRHRPHPLHRMLIDSSLSGSLLRVKPTAVCESRNDWEGLAGHVGNVMRVMRVMR